MRILITGGAGFIASHIADKLVGQGHHVIIVDNLSTGNIDNVNKNAAFYEIDITDLKLLEIFRKEKPEYVVHHAAQIDIQKSIQNPVFDGNVNILGTINVLECCRNLGIKKIVYASSAAVYGEPEYLPIDEKHQIWPISYYGISKYTPEQYFQVYNRLYGLKYAILRYANVYGIRQDPKGEGGVVSIFMDMMFKGKNPTIFGDGEQTRDFIYVDDVAEANLCALQKGENDIFNIGTGVATSVNKLFFEMNKIMGNQLSSLYGQARKGDILHSYFDISKSKTILKWQPKYTLREGLEETIQYYKEKYYDCEALA